MNLKNLNSPLKQLLKLFFRAIVCSIGLIFSIDLFAMDFISVAQDHTPVYSTIPSTSRDKAILCLSRYYPLQVLSKKLDSDWLQVQDYQRRVFWVSKHLVFSARTVVSKDEVLIYEQADLNSPKIFRAAKNLAMWLVSDIQENNFLHVRHPEGLSGYLPLSDKIWGFDSN